MASKNKIKEYLFAKYVDYLTRKVTFYKSRQSLCIDYESEHIKEINEASERKIAHHQALNARLYAASDYDSGDQQVAYEQTTKLEIANYQNKLRMKYRVEREKTRRKIAKLMTRGSNENPIQELSSNLLKYEQEIANHLEVYKAQRLADFEKTQHRENAKPKLSQDELANLEIKLASDNEVYAKQVNNKKGETIGRFVAKNKALISKLEKRLKTYQVKLDVALQELQLNSYVLPPDVVLRAENLCMFFGGVKAVNDLTFDVKQGEIFGLIGPNGAGKTTVFNCITQFYKPTSGHLYLRNRLNEIVDLNKLVVHNVILQGIVRTFQNLEVVKEVSVLDNLLIAAHRQYQSNFFEHMLHLPIVGLEEKVIRARADKVLAFMGLSQYRNWLVWGLPYGVLKKIEIARTLMADPHLIILDEPAAGLNDSETVDLANLIRRIRDEYKCTILLVEHDMGLVMDVCDNILAISFGKKLAIGTAKEIQSNRDVQAAYLGAPEEETA